MHFQDSTPVIKNMYSILDRRSTRRKKEDEEGEGGGREAKSN
jgi:hypothetical protein